MNVVLEGTIAEVRTGLQELSLPPQKHIRVVVQIMEDQALFEMLDKTKELSEDGPEKYEEVYLTAVRNGMPLLPRRAVETAPDLELVNTLRDDG